jgi:hypothetical protein
MGWLAPLMRSRRFSRAALWIALLMLVAGGITFLAVYVGNTGKSFETPAPTNQQTLAANPKTVPLARAARFVAGRFILTAVRRRHLEQAWKLVSPNLKGGMTLAEWKTGNIPVVPFLAPIDRAPMKVDYSWPREAQLEVALLPVPTAHVKGQIFVLIVKRFGTARRAHWLVDSWVPLAPPAIKN